MDLVIELLALILGLFFCIYPVKGVEIITLWPRFAFKSFIPNIKLNRKVEEAIRLIEDDPEQFPHVFPRPFALVRISGFVLLFIALSGFCISISS